MREKCIFTKGESEFNSAKRTQQYMQKCHFDIFAVSRDFVYVSFWHAHMQNRFILWPSTPKNRVAVAHTDTIYSVRRTCFAGRILRFFSVIFSKWNFISLQLLWESFSFEALSFSIFLIKRIRSAIWFIIISLYFLAWPRASISLSHSARSPISFSTGKKSKTWNCFRKLLE